MRAHSDSPQRVRDSIFISYSHADSEVFSQLQAVLGRLATNINLTIWSDARITPASQWRGEIEEALATSAAAILLVSRAFLRSNFIRDHELPPLRAAAHRGELRIFIIILEECDHHDLTETFQAETTLRVRSTNSSRQNEKRFGIALNPLSEESLPKLTTKCASAQKWCASGTTWQTTRR